MALYGLTDSELFWDKASDTKMLLAWSRTCVVCAFRGTASLNNAMSDLQVCPCIGHARTSALRGLPVRLGTSWAVPPRKPMALPLQGHWSAVCSHQLQHLPQMLFVSVHCGDPPL